MACKNFFVLCTQPLCLLHVMSLQVFCLGVLIASAVALSNIDAFFENFPEDSEFSDDRDRYRGVAGWMLFVGIAGIVVQAVMTIVRALYYGEIITSQFVAFGIAVSFNMYLNTP